MARKKAIPSIPRTTRSLPREAARLIKAVQDLKNEVDPDVNDPNQFFSMSDYKSRVFCRATVPGTVKNGKPGIIHFFFPSIDEVDALGKSVGDEASMAAALNLLANCLADSTGTLAFESKEEIRQVMSISRILSFANAIASSSSVEVEKNV